MSDIYFQCICGKNLAVDEAGIGRTVSCPECKKPVVVPQPAILFDCLKCANEMLAPEAMIGKEILCVSCNTTIIVPAATRLEDLIKFNCPNCQRHLKAPADMAGELIPCPNCHQNIKVPQKADLAISKPPPTSELTQGEPSSSSRSFFNIIGVGVFILALIAGLTILILHQNHQQAVERDTHSLADPMALNRADIKAKRRPLQAHEMTAKTIDSASLAKTIQKDQQAKDLSNATNDLNDKIQRNEPDPKRIEAERLLTKLQTQSDDTEALATAIDEAVSKSETDIPQALGMLEDAMRKHAQATNCDEAKQLISQWKKRNADAAAHLRQQFDDSGALTQAIATAKVEQPGNSTIQIPKDAGQQYPRATSQRDATVLINKFNQQQPPTKSTTANMDLSQGQVTTGPMRQTPEETRQMPSSYVFYSSGKEPPLKQKDAKPLRFMPSPRMKGVALIDYAIQVTIDSDKRILDGSTSSSSGNWSSKSESGFTKYIPRIKITAKNNLIPESSLLVIEYFGNQVGSESKMRRECVEHIPLPHIVKGKSVVVDANGIEFYKYEHKSSGSYGYRSEFGQGMELYGVIVSLFIDSKLIIQTCSSSTLNKECTDTIPPPQQYDERQRYYRAYHGYSP